MNKHYSIHKVTLHGILICAILLISTGVASGQSDLKHITLLGYVKDLQMVISHPVENRYLYANQIHNRLNFAFFPDTVFTGKLEIRNRVFTGSLVEELPGFAESLDQDDGIVDLSATATIGNQTVINAAIDRAWIGFRKGNLDMTVGRQRINWGVNTIWNPNDFFNAYNFFDFDYEERPGSDAIRIQYMTGDFSFVEAAASKGKYNGDEIYALVYRFNTRGYDIQFTGGYVRERPAAGIGWAGNIRDAGFKTEASWFGKGGPNNENAKLILSSQVDYSFNPGWYMLFAYLYNSSQVDYYRVTAEGTDVSQQDPFLYEHALYGQLSKEISPIVNAGLGVMYATDEILVVIPTFSYSLSTNWDLLLYGQYYSSRLSIRNDNISVFLRLKWSFAK